MLSAAPESFNDAERYMFKDFMQRKKKHFFFFCLFLNLLAPAAGALQENVRLKWTELRIPPSPVVCLLRPALVCICKYSISDICSLIIFKSDQDTTAAEAIHKEAHILFLLLLFFVGMELVSTKPTKPTCSYVSNKRLFLFFCLFLFITGVYDGVQDDKDR